jgi:hypothetical protein
MRDDETIRQIERFFFRRAPVAAAWRNKGYTLLPAETGRPIARLRSYEGRDELMEILYWSLKGVGPPSARSYKP